MGAKFDWLSQKCCKADCPVFTFEVKYVSLNKRVRAYVGKVADGSEVVLPVKVWRNQTQDMSYSFSNSTASSTSSGDYSYQVNYSYHDILGDPGFGNIDLSYAGSASSSSSSNDPDNPSSFNNSWVVTNGDPQMVVRTFRLVDGQGQSSSTTSQKEAGIFWPYNGGGPVTTVRSYSSEVTWAEVDGLVDLDAEFERDSGQIFQAKSVIHRVGVTHDGVVYSDAPYRIVRRAARFRYRLPSDFTGSYYGVRYIHRVRDLESDEVTDSEVIEVVWSGPGDMSDPESESWFSSWQDVLEVDGSEVQVVLVSYRCYHGGAWE